MWKKRCFLIACVFSSSLLFGCFEEPKPPAKYVPPPCDSGTIKCENNVSRTCVEGRWQNAQLCLNGCDAAGKCIIDNSPDSESKVPTQHPTDCAPGTWQCYNGNSYTCSAGILVLVETCITSCNTNTGKCSDDLPKTCTEGDLRCHQGDSFVCSAQNWVLQEACTTPCNNKTGKCSEDFPKPCKEGDLHCHQGNSFICSAEKWHLQEACATPCNNKTGKCSEPILCPQGETSCVSDIEYTCANGSWKKTQYCSDGCDQDYKQCKTTPQCAAGDTKCQDDTFYLCTSDGWSVSQKCEFGCNDTNNGCHPGGECNSGEYECQGNISYYCSNQRWKKNECVHGCREKTGKCYDRKDDVCTSDEKTCTEDGFIHECSLGNWQRKGSCEYGCDTSTGKCNPCPVGTYKCEWNDFYKCNENGEWVELECKYCSEKTDECIPEDEVECQGLQNERFKCEDGIQYYCNEDSYKYEKLRDCANGCAGQEYCNPEYGDPETFVPACFYHDKFESFYEKVSSDDGTLQLVECTYRKDERFCSHWRTPELPECNPNYSYCPPECTDYTLMQCATVDGVIGCYPECSTGYYAEHDMQKYDEGPCYSYFGDINCSYHTRYEFECTRSEEGFLVWKQVDEYPITCLDSKGNKCIPADCKYGEESGYCIQGSSEESLKFAINCGSDNKPVVNSCHRYAHGYCAVVNGKANCYNQGECKIKEEGATWTTCRDNLTADLSIFETWGTMVTLECIRTDAGDLIATIASKQVCESHRCNKDKTACSD